MIVYAESNFVLELALGREEAEAAEWILRRTEEGVCRLALPALALYEPFSTITARDRAQAQLARSLNEQLSELRRSVPHEEAVAELRRAPEILLDIGRSECSKRQSPGCSMFTPEFISKAQRSRARGRINRNTGSHLRTPSSTRR